MENKSTLLILTDWFAPGYKAGGPIRSCVNLARALQHEFTVKVITLARDLGDTVPYPEIRTDSWQGFDENIDVYYLSAPTRQLGKIRSLIRAISPDFLYLNGMFSLPFTIYPLWLLRMGRIKSTCVLAPRGMLKASALAMKKRKKQLFLSGMKSGGFMRKVRFHATDQQEIKDIQTVWGDKPQIFFAPNLPDPAFPPFEPPQKLPGHLALYVAARIHPIKNLHVTLQLLEKVKGHVSLTIVGPVEDKGYWQTCQQQIGQLPPNIRVNHLGTLEPSLLREKIPGFHALILPTQGENFGHAIFEALQAGRPVLISDETPWRDLQRQQAGWDLPLDQEGAWVKAMQQMIDFDEDAFGEWARKSRAFAEKYVQDPSHLAGYQKIFSKYKKFEKQS